MAEVGYTRAEEQDSTADLELATDAYDDVYMRLAYKIDFQNSQLELFPERQQPDRRRATPAHLIHQGSRTAAGSNHRVWHQGYAMNPQAVIKQKPQSMQQVLGSLANTPGPDTRDLKLCRSIAGG